jgi:hypothetical protein
MGSKAAIGATDRDEEMAITRWISSAASVASRRASIDPSIPRFTDVEHLAAAGRHL